MEAITKTKYITFTSPGQAELAEKPLHAGRRDGSGEAPLLYHPGS